MICIFIAIQIFFLYLPIHAEGYATTDESNNGGFLIPNVKKVLSKSNFVKQHNLGSIVKQIRKATKLQTIIISQTFKDLEITQIVENRSSMEDNVFVKPKK